MTEIGWFCSLLAQVSVFHVEQYLGSGAITAIALIVLLAVLLPRGRRSSIGSPVILLALYFTMRLLHAATPGDSLVDIPFHFFAILFLFLSLGRSSFLLAFHSILTRRFGTGIPKIVLDVIQALIFTAAFLFTLNAAGVTLTSLVTGSALVTAAIGLSMRDTLGNLFAGLAIQMQQPFEIGDWIQFDQHLFHIGEVLEINWRATKVLTLDQVEVIVPNSELAQAPIRNFMKPHGYSRRSIYVVAPYHVPPRQVHQLILEAVGGAWGVLEFPAPTVVTSDFNDRGVEYWVRIFTDRFDKRDAVDGGVRDRIWYAFHRNGISIPSPLRHVQLEEVTHEKRGQEEATRIDQNKKVLRGVEFLKVLPDGAIEQLAQAARRHLYAHGEIIVRQGDEGSELFILTRGEAAVTATNAEGTSVEIGRLGPCKFFGEMACMTGERRSATVTVTKDCETYIIDKDAFKPILEASPELAETMSEILATRRAEIDQRSAEVSGNGESSYPRRGDLLDRIREFFSL
ncbi:MAG TPA: mechanosensitive ion channel family protein [Pirellulaceae bacterium]|nr:mechanosensitive ion channel family protein [Pirellulaceae bacterium]